MEQNQPFSAVEKIMKTKVVTFEHKEYALEFKKGKVISVAINDGGDSKAGDAWWRDLSPGNDRFPTELVKKYKNNLL